MDRLGNLEGWMKDLGDGQLLKCIGAGAASYQPGVYDLYLKEAEQRGLQVATVKKAQREGAKMSRISDIVWGYVFSLISFLAVFHFFSLASRLRRHRSGEAILEGQVLKHVVTQFWICAGQLTLVVVSIIFLIYRLIS